MSRLTKISLLILGIVVVLTIVMVVLVKTLVTPERIRETVVPFTEHSLKRKVALENIHIGLFSGISLQDLQVKRKDGSGNFIAVKSMDMHYQFLPLLTGKVVIDHINLVEPQIVVVRYPNGRFNFDDLMGKTDPQKGNTSKSEQSDTSTKSGRPASPAASPATALNLLVNRITVSGGQLLFIDRSQSEKTPLRYTLEHLSLEAKNITLDRSFPVELSASLGAAKIALSGAYDVKNRSGNANLDIESLDIAGFAPYFQNAISGKLGSGVLTVNLKTTMSPSDISAKGKMTLDRLDLFLDAAPKAELKQAKLEIDSSLSYKMNEKLLDFSSLLVKLNNIPLRTVGKVNFSAKEPDLAMALFLDHLNLEKLNQGLPAGLAKDIRAYGLSGQVNALVELAGKPSAGARLLKKADLNLEDVQTNLSGIQAGINGSVDFSGQQIKADNLALNLGDQPAQLSFHAANLFSGHITGGFQLTADTMDFNKLIPASKKMAQKEALDDKATPPQNNTGTVSSNAVVDTPQPANQQAKPSQEEIGPFSVPADIQGMIRITKGTYRQLPMDNISADIQLKNNHLQIMRSGFGVAGGQLSATADIDLAVKGLAYRGKLDLTKLQLAVLDSGLFPDSDQSVSGVAESHTTFAGHGSGSESFIKTLQADGNIQVNDGEVSGSPMVIALANFLGSTDLQKLSFTRFQSSYTLRNGVVALQGALDSSSLKLNPEGTVAVDGPIDLSLNARLSPQTMAGIRSGSDLKQIMTDENGWGLLPVKVDGTLSEPRIALDSKALQKQAVGKARQELEKQLLKKIAPNEKDQKSSPTKQLLNSTLKSLFGN